MQNPATGRAAAVSRVCSSMSTDPVWLEGRRLAEQRLSAPEFRAWIECLAPRVIKSDVAVVDVPTNPMKEWIADRYSALLDQCLSEAAGRTMSVRFAVPDANGAGDANPGVSPSSSTDTPLDGLRLQLVAEQGSIDPRFRFDNFVVGACNQFAHAAAYAVGNRHVRGYNPFFIYGNVGLGKTHLLNAVGNFVLSRKPTARVRYVTSEAFTNELIAAIRSDRHEEFRAMYRSVDLLLIDDIQLIAKLERTQEEFFYTFNSLYQAQRQIVVTSDRFPKDIPELDDRLRSRFEWGLIADMQAPDLETRVAILTRKSESEGLSLPDEATLFLATHIRSNIRELEGSLNRVCAYASLTGQPITIELIRKVLREALRDPDTPITLDDIQKTVAKAFDVRVSDLRSNRKLRTLTVPRQVAMYLCRRLTSSSFPHIGDQFGKDHSTVIHAVRRIERQLEDDAEFRSRIERIVSELEEAR